MPFSPNGLQCSQLVSEKEEVVLSSTFQGTDRVESACGTTVYKDVCD